MLIFRQVRIATDGNDILLRCVPVAMTPPFLAPEIARAGLVLRLLGSIRSLHRRGFDGGRLDARSSRRLRSGRSGWRSRRSWRLNVLRARAERKNTEAGQYQPREPLTKRSFH